ncbi:hypothetical protein GGS20DRAFT_598333 [Poronia punctata]|nr:hypothetical protein GGS20DRAFT_598333 [Poronia punctata]
MAASCPASTRSPVPVPSRSDVYEGTTFTRQETPFSAQLVGTNQRRQAGRATAESPNRTVPYNPALIKSMGVTWQETCPSTRPPALLDNFNSWELGPTFLRREDSIFGINTTYPSNLVDLFPRTWRRWLPVRFRTLPRAACQHGPFRRIRLITVDIWAYTPATPYSSLLLHLHGQPARQTDRERSTDEDEPRSSLTSRPAGS